MLDWVKHRVLCGIWKNRFDKRHLPTRGWEDVNVLVRRIKWIITLTHPHPQGMITQARTMYAYHTYSATFSRFMGAAGGTENGSKTTSISVVCRFRIKLNRIGIKKQITSIRTLSFIDDRFSRGWSGGFSTDRTESCNIIHKKLNSWWSFFDLKKRRITIKECISRISLDEERWDIEIKGVEIGTIMNRLVESFLYQNSVLEKK